MEASKTFKKGNYILEVFYNHAPENPRHYQDLTKLILFHKRYDLGDEHDYKQGDYSNWGQMEADIIKKEEPGFILPVYMYEHGNISLSTSSFNDRWDSGQVGFVIMDWMTFSGMSEEQAKALIEDQLKEYTSYLNGEIYYFQISELLTCNLGCQHKRYVADTGDYYELDHCFKDGLLELSKYVGEEVQAWEQAKPSLRLSQWPLNAYSQ